MFGSSKEVTRSSRFRERKEPEQLLEYNFIHKGIKYTVFLSEKLAETIHAQNGEETGYSYTCRPLDGREKGVFHGRGQGTSYFCAVMDYIESAEKSWQKANPSQELLLVETASYN